MGTRGAVAGGRARTRVASQDESFGARLRRLREARVLTQEGLAERAGPTADAIWALERA